ncbi:MAG: FAD-dependent thymidylate synthase, partial [Candidatus Micrarchaeota archaeon]
LAHTHDAPDGGESITLVDYDKDAEDKIATAALYPHMRMPMEKVKEIVAKMDAQEKADVVKAYINERGNRRHKPGRAFEHAHYTFDICANFGAYRDMHRHRILTQQRQPLSTHHGYKLPSELVEAGYESEFKDVMDAAKNAYSEIWKKHPEEAQYVVPLAYNIRWYMSFNAREAYHMLELRSSMQGHPDYRHIAQEMSRQMEKAHPSIASGMKFMDMNEYALERLEAEKRIDKKIAEISEKYGK